MGRKKWSQIRAKAASETLEAAAELLTSMPRKKWAEIKAGLPPESIARAAVKTERILASLRLGELRKARGLTQEAMAERLEIRQVSASRMESRTDVRVSTLRSVVEAMGGEIEIRARFPDAEYDWISPERTRRSSRFPAPVTRFWLAPTQAGVWAGRVEWTDADRHR